MPIEPAASTSQTNTREDAIASTWARTRALSLNHVYAESQSLGWSVLRSLEPRKGPETASPLRGPERLSPERR